MDRKIDEKAVDEDGEQDVGYLVPAEEENTYVMRTPFFSKGLGESLL